MTDIVGWLFSSTGFMPHGHCYLWQPGTLWLNVGSDGLIAAAYYAIPFALYYFVSERRAEIPYPWILLMFAAFILLCGTTHLMEIWTVWHPDYRAAGALKLLTGVVSLATMLALLQLMPKAMLLRSPSQLQLEVQSRTAELAEVNVKLRAEIAARDLAQGKLREQDRRKDEFLATLAHELRNPLAPIRHAVKLLGLKSADLQQQQWGREVIARQAQRMALLLDDLLDVSRITRGRLQLKKERVDLAVLINAAAETVRPLTEEKQQILDIHLPPQSVGIEVDPLRLSQAISNLLTNAAKFTPAHGTISLSARLTSSDLIISVRDTGAGFETEAAPLLFEMFSQADAGVEGAEGGLGIGLSLVKGLIELHGGTVRAHSAGKGLGAEFSLVLPISVVLPTAMLLPPTVAWNISVVVPSAAAIQPLQPEPAPAPERATILVADDNRDAADSMGMLLELAGHDVLIAHSGRQALDMGREHRPDIVLLDIGMPDMSGYEVARLIRNEAWAEGVLLVAITGWGQPGDKHSARAAGFDRHLTKPVNPDIVEEIIKVFLGSLRGEPPPSSA